MEGFEDVMMGGKSSGWTWGAGVERVRALYRWWRKKAYSRLGRSRVTSIREDYEVSAIKKIGPRLFRQKVTKTSDINDTAADFLS